MRRRPEPAAPPQGELWRIDPTRIDGGRVLSPAEPFWFPLAVCPRAAGRSPAMGFTWDDVDEIADALVVAHSDMDPMELSFPRLHALITELTGFVDDPDRSDDGKLEAIQMAWYDRIG